METYQSLFVYAQMSERMPYGTTSTLAKGDAKSAKNQNQIAAPIQTIELCTCNEK